MEKKLPKNWVEVQLIELLKDFENGKRPKGGVQGILEGIPSIGGEHINSEGGFKFEKIKYIPEDFAEKITKGKIKQKDILIVKDGATTGKVSFVDNTFPFSYAFVNEHVFICRVFDNINARALFYYLFGKEGQERILNNFTGSAQGGINQKFAKNTLIPLPPLPEQTRIVAKLDQLFGQLELIKESLDKIPQLLKDFRQQVLTQAVTGKLTEEWRSEKRLSEWIESSIGENSELVTKGSSPKWQGINYVEEYNKDSILFITSENVDRFNIIEGKFKYLEIGFNEKQKRSILNVGDVLTNIVGGSIGRTCVWNYKFRANINQAVCLIRPNEKKINSDFLAIYLNSDKGLTSLFSDVVDVARANISLANIKNTLIKLPSIEEQQEIVNRVETLFSKADTLEQQYQTLKQKIDTLPQAILHKAFKGELVPQLDNDGDARELLEEIKNLKS